MPDRCEVINVVTPKREVGNAKTRKNTCRRPEERDCAFQATVLVSQEFPGPTPLITE
jgi:hypothetical protein